MPAASQSTNSRAVVLDWGTSSLRAMLVDGDGTTLDTRSSGQGVQFMAGRSYEDVLREIAGDWLGAADQPAIYALGMVTSRNGWVEVPYVDCPADAATIARGIVTRNLQSGSQVILLPGLRDPAARPFPDVMRGEETQAVGFGLSQDRTLVLPGTHSKWLRIEGGRIARFQTFVTGELFSLMSTQSFIARGEVGEGPARWSAFDLGVEKATADDEDAAAMLSALFSVRTGMLAGKLTQADLRDYVSGLLIGLEFRQARRWWKAGDEIGLIGAAALTERYARAATSVGLTALDGPPDASVRGVMTIAKHIGKTGT